jgi:preprotein translocase subunit SecE
LWVQFLPGLPVATPHNARRFSCKKRRSNALAEKEKKVKKSENAVERYLRETTGELRKVNWPKWPESRHLTQLVLLVMVTVGLYLALVDFFSHKLVYWVLGI